MKRLWALIVALVVGWLAFGAPTSVAAEPPTGILAYAYNSSHAPDADAVSHDERGPPEASAARAIHNAVDRRSNGASTCPCDLTTRAPYDYDAPRPHERGASTTADTQVVVTADLRRPHPAGVAAETGGAAAETGIASALTASEQRSVASLQRQIA